MELQNFIHVDVTDTVAVGEHETLVSHILLNPFDPSAGHGIQSGIHNRDTPWL